MKVALCFFGVIPRSIRYVYEPIEERIIKPLKDNFDVEIITVNLNIENSEIDGVKVDQNDCKIIPSDIFYEEKQSYADYKIKKLAKKVNVDYCRNMNPRSNWNSIRCMYIEYCLHRILKNRFDRYDSVVVYSADYYPMRKINIDHVKDVVEKKDIIYTSGVLDCNGYTDGYYIGCPEKIIKITSRYLDLEEILKEENDSHEHILKKSFNKHGITRIKTDMYYCKIRASKEALILWEINMDNWLKEHPKDREDLRAFITNHNIRPTRSF